MRQEQDTAMYDPPGPVEHIGPESSDPPLAELFWGGYLTALYNAGAIRPTDDIAQIKADFMAGLRGEEA